MHKKLYKAKKNWLIGVIVGSVLVFGGATSVSADNNETLNGNNSQVIENNKTSTNNYGTSDLIKAEPTGSQLNINSDNSQYKLDSNVSISTDSHDVEGVAKNPGFNIEVTGNKNIPKLQNAENVTYARYSNAKEYSTQKPLYDNSDDKIQVDNVLSGYASPVSNSEAGKYDLQGNVNHDKNSVTIYERNNSKVNTRWDRSNEIESVHSVSVQGNSITNRISINSKGDIKQGSWGVAIEPDWDSNYYEGNFWEDNPIYEPYKKDNYFYYIIKDKKGIARWIEIIRPINGSVMFPGGASLSKNVEPILGGHLVEGYLNDSPTNRMFILANEGKNADISYSESYYEVNVGNTDDVKTHNANPQKSNQIKVVFVNKDDHQKELGAPFFYKGEAGELPDWDMITMHLPSGYTIINASEGNYYFKGRTLYIPVAKSSNGYISGDKADSYDHYKVDGSVDVSKEVPGEKLTSDEKEGLNDEFEKDSVDDALKDAGIDVGLDDILNDKIDEKLGKQLNESNGINQAKEKTVKQQKKMAETTIDLIKNVSNVGVDVSENGFHYNQAADFLGAITKAITTVSEMTLEQSTTSKVKQIFNKVSDNVVDDTVNSVKTVLDASGEVGSLTKYEHKYMMGKNESAQNKRERQHNYLKTRAKQLETTKQGLSTISGHFINTKLPEGLITAATLLCAIAVAVLVKYLWHFRWAQSMARTFGLKSKNWDKGYVDEIDEQERENNSKKSK